MPRKGQHMPEGANIRISETLKRRCEDSAVRKDMSRRGKLSYSGPDGPTKRGEATKRNWTNPDTRAKMIAGLSSAKKRNWEDPIYREKKTASIKAMWADDEFRKRHTPFKGRVHTPAAIQKMRDSTTRFYSDPAARKRQSDVHKTLWQDPMFARRMIQAFHTTPTNLEIAVYDLLQELCPGEYAINTKAELLSLGRKIPDFVHVAGQKKLIEVNGDYWHRGQNSQDRIDYFKKLGYDALVIWEHEMGDRGAVKAKILKFTYEAV